MLTNTIQVKMTDLNTANQTRNANLNYNGTIENVCAVYISKFTICKKMPVYIPKLVVDDEHISINGYTKQSLDANYIQLPYRMNTAVLIKNIKNNQYAMSNVRYESNRVVNKPFPFNMSDETLSRNIVINNEYFYMYSTLELTRMMIKCIKKCLDAVGVTYNENDVYIGLLENGFYQLMVKATILSSVKIYFNYELQNMFPFDYINSLSLMDGFEEIVFEATSMADIEGIDYLVAQTMYRSTRIYPFRSLIFTSNNLPVQKILNANELSKSMYNDKVAELLSYTLNIDSPDQSNDCLEFQLNSLYNTLTLSGNTLNNLTLEVYLQTIEGYTVRLNLKKNEFVQVMVHLIAE